MTETPPTPDTPPEQSAIAQYLTSRANAPGSEHEVTQRDDAQGDDDAQRVPVGHPSGAQRDDDDQGDDDDQRDDDQGDDQGDDDTFPRSYVQRLRERSNGYRLQLRERESDVDRLQRQLFAERLQRLDLVIDHDAVPYDPALLDDDDALQEHVEGLLAAKPYLRKRKVSGNIGQHSSNGGGSSFSLMDTLRHNAS